MIPNADHYVYLSKEPQVVTEMNAFLADLHLQKETHHGVGNDYVWSAAGLQGKSYGREDKSAAMYSAFGWRYLSWP
jgi:hypothetical protein